MNVASKCAEFFFSHSTLPCRNWMSSCDEIWTNEIYTLSIKAILFFCFIKPVVCSFELDDHASMSIPTWWWRWLKLKFPLFFREQCFRSWKWYTRISYRNLHNGNGREKFVTLFMCAVYHQKAKYLIWSSV